MAASGIDRDKEGQGPGLPSPVRRGESALPSLAIRIKFKQGILYIPQARLNKLWK